MGPEWNAIICTCATEVLHTHMSADDVLGLQDGGSYGERGTGRGRMRDKALGGSAIFHSFKKMIWKQTQKLDLTGVPLPITFLQYFYMLEIFHFEKSSHIA